MTTDFSNMVYDPVTGTTKRKNNTDLPYLNPNETSQGYLPYKPKDYNPADLEQGNKNVMGTAQQAALTQPQNTAMQDQTTQMTQKLMTDPNMGRDWGKYNTGMMSKFDADRASGIKQYKEANTGMGGAGQVQDNLVRLALQQNLDRGLYENELENQAYEKGMENYLSALGQGREQGQYLDEAQQNYINNLLNVRGAYEGERSQESSNALQKELTAANIASAQKIAGMEIASREKLAADQNYLTQQGINLQSAGLYGYNRQDGTHVYGTAELSAMKFGLESKDLENQTVELFGGMVDSNGDGVPDKQIFGKYDLLSAADKREADTLYGYDVTDTAGNVVGRVSGTLQLQNDRSDIERQGLELDKAKVFGYWKDTNGDGAADTYVDGELDLALKNYGLDIEQIGIDKDTAYGYVQTDENGNPIIDPDGKPVRIKGTMEIQVEKLGVEKLLANLQERQINTDEIEQVYNYINDQVAIGNASPVDAFNFVKNVVSEYGATLTEADKNAIYGELAQDFKVQQYQFALTNPDFAEWDENGNFVNLTDEGMKYFGNYVNSTLYGESIIPTIGGSTGYFNTAGYQLSDNRVVRDDGQNVNPYDLAIAFKNANDQNNKNYQQYQTITANAKTISPRIKSTGYNTLDIGADTGDVVNVNGRLMVILNKKRNGRVDNFEIMDVASGTKKYFDAFSSGTNSVNNFNDWVNTLT
ncbi:MAG: hypothetical protein JXB48_21170 [Candidatus Latescibacteria bacterium]|nr:hypothetical protein [Candidatus Latescibacterota bacterium]